MQKKKILIIEDDAYVHELLDCLLTYSRDIEVRSVNDGAKALDLLDKEIPDLIFVDFMLPQLDGIEICKKLKADDRTNKIPIILMSAATKIKDVNKDDLSIDEIILKPFDMTDVLNKVDQLLNKG